MPAPAMTMIFRERLKTFATVCSRAGIGCMSGIRGSDIAKNVVIRTCGGGGMMKKEERGGGKKSR
jgi:hypothetical protein